jgi:hypothetical protein
MRYWSIVRHRKRVVAASVVTVVAFFAAWMAFVSWTYRATVVVSVPGMCPHGIVVGEPRIDISLGQVFISKEYCPECRTKALRADVVDKK